MSTTKTNKRRASDVDFHWVVRELGDSFSDLAGLARDWVAEQTAAIDMRMHGLALFFDRYLHKHGLPSDVDALFTSHLPIPDFFETCCPKSRSGVVYNNYVCDFADWVISKRFSRHGLPSSVLEEVRSPVKRLTQNRASYVPTETVRTPLPYRYIMELRDIIAAGRSFRDWRWAYEEFGETRNRDWFKMDRSKIDIDDPDCVWRERGKGDEGVVEMWSPVRFTVLLVKLLVPLRTYQVRMLDSGEADSLRYSSGLWQPNDNPLKPTSGKVQRGVFRRVIDRDIRKETTVLYINSNKTADINRKDGKVGYVIPWQHEELLFWLEKLRDWQERYNGIDAPTKWAELGVQHLGNAKSDAQLANLPDTCFLFRDAAAPSKDDRRKPIPDEHLDRAWYSVLQELEVRCAKRGETLANGGRLKFVRETKNKGLVTYFPLHSLRVSLLTCLALDGDVPLPILSKLVAGHSRLMMTLYYVKASPGRVSRVLREAESRLSDTADAQLRTFLQEASYDQLLDSTAHNSPEGVQAALSPSPSGRIAASWTSRSLGVCLAGGNTSEVDNRRVAGCHNGGPQLTTNNASPTHAAYAPVPGGSGNCVRCRWFITEPKYLDALRAHFNSVSYRLSEAANKARSLESRLEAVKAEKAQAEAADVPFPNQSAYLQLERLWETSINETDLLANDLLATLRLVNRCMSILQRDDGCGSNAMIAGGTANDIKMALVETDSELLQLAEVCKDAEIYPDEDYGKAVLRRSQVLDSALLREGRSPIFLSFSEEEQLKVGNHVMRRLTQLPFKGKSAPAGLEAVVGVIDSKQRLSDIFDLDGFEFSLLSGSPSSYIPLITNATN